MFPKVAQKVATAKINVKLKYFKMAQKGANYFALKFVADYL